VGVLGSAKGHNLPVPSVMIGLLYAAEQK